MTTEGKGWVSGVGREMELRVVKGGVIYWAWIGVVMVEGEGEVWVRREGGRER